MDLILWRHAQADEWVEGCDDHARKLTHKGKAQAQRLAKWLERQLPEATRVYASPARRTEQTAQTLGRKYQLREELLPERSVEDLLTLSQWPQSKQPVLIVGHQPVLGQVLSQLLELPKDVWPMRKGALWWLRQRERHGESETVIVTVQSPELL